MNDTRHSWAPPVTFGILILAIFAALTLPLSAPVLDFLLCVNMVSSLVILVLTTKVTDPIQLSTFPTLLFLLTLFRLALNIASTRLILSAGKAGHIIETFGRLITNGNLFVGMVGFMVLQVIQFMIIAKGSERVAEVAARFTLDALPGRQMSIDSDLRAGLITAQEAQKKRNRLLLESRFFGAMDGAMKFVKGEAVAGFLIVFINLIAGMAVGMVSLGYTVQKALAHFAELTIGDGLAAQIPSLTLAIATGFLITRVNSDENPVSLDRDVFRQILNHPAALASAGVLCLFISIMSPAAKIELAGSGLLLLAIPFGIRFQHHHKKQSSQDFFKRHVLDVENKATQGIPVALSLNMHPNMLNAQQLVQWDELFTSFYPLLKKRLEARMGLDLPDLKLMTDPAIPQKQIRINLEEIDVLTLTLSENELKALNACLLKHLVRVLSSHAGDFMGIQNVKNRIEKLKETHADLVNEIIPRFITLPKLTDLLKRLVSEGLPVTHLPLILESLAHLKADQKDPVLLVEELRQCLKKQISHLYAREGSLRAFLLDPVVEDEIKENTSSDNGEYFLTLAPERMHRIVQAVRDTLHRHDLKKTPGILLTRPEIRYPLKRLLAQDLPNVPVLSFSELDPNLAVDCRDTIGVS